MKVCFHSHFKEAVILDNILRKKEKKKERKKERERERERKKKERCLLQSVGKFSCACLCCI